jgi:hypothetical protein
MSVAMSGTNSESHNGSVIVNRSYARCTLQTRSMVDVKMGNDYKTKVNINKGIGFDKGIVAETVRDALLCLTSLR